MARPKKRQRLPSSRKPQKRPDLLESLSADDPNVEVGKRLYLEGWADSHGLVADSFAGKISLSELVDGCIHAFEQGAQAQVTFKDDTSAPARCRALDELSKKFISKFKKSAARHSKGLGRAKVTAAIERVSRGVAEITSRSKQRILLQARDREIPVMVKVESSESRPIKKGPLVGSEKEETADSTFWKERQAEFAKYADRSIEPDALWNVESGVWFLWLQGARNGIVPPEQEKIFNAIARTALARLVESRTARAAEPWQRWLDFMRRNGWGFLVTGNVACTELEWDAGVKDGRPLAQVRKEQKYSFGDEWKKVYERTETGQLRRLNARELKGKSSEELQKHYHWLENGTIKRVFESSASFCEELASLALNSEIAQRISDGPEGEGKWVHLSHSDWRNDAALARTPPPFLQPIKGPRLEAIAVLYKDAAAAVQKALPETDEKVEQCLWPTLSQYASSVFDAIARDELRAARAGAKGGYEDRLRSQCIPEVIQDVCRPIIGQFLITLRQVIESLGSNRLPQIDQTRRTLWKMTTEALGGPFTDNLAKRLTVELGARSAYWESKAVSTKRTTDPSAKSGRPRAVAIIGEKVTELRGELSQGTFTRVTKLSADVIQRAERGEATGRTIRKLCQYAKSKGFSLTPDTLRKNTPPKTAKT